MSKMKKHLFGISCVMLAAIGLVVVLAWGALKPINQKNGFVRKTIGEMKSIQTINKNEDVVEISEADKSLIFFKTKDPAKLYFTDGQLQRGRYRNLFVPSNERISTAYSMFVDSPTIEIFANNVPAIIRTYFNTINSSVTWLKFPTFSQVVKISENTLIGRGFDTSVRGDQIFLKGDINSGIVGRENGISQLKHDGGISTDGYLTYDNSTGTIVYVNYYNNNFLAIDTNLNLKYRATTIDTAKSISNFAGAVAGNMYTNTAPTRVINNLGCASNGILYNYSKLKADNDLDNLDNNSPIDLYAISNGSYLGTIYVLHFKKEKLNQFKIYENNLVALYKTQIILYKLNVTGQK